MRYRYALDLEALAPRPGDVRWLTLDRLKAEDLDSVAALMLDAYRGTVDDEGETLEEARGAVRELLSGSPPPGLLLGLPLSGGAGQRLPGRDRPAIPGSPDLLRDDAPGPEGLRPGPARPGAEPRLPRGLRSRAGLGHGHRGQPPLGAPPGAAGVPEACIRPAVPADSPRIADVYLASRKAFLPFAPLAHTDAEVRRWVADVLLPSGGVTVAVRDEEILGMMALSRSGGHGWIDQLYLRPGAAGQGLGSRLLERAKRELGTPIRLHTFQDNAGARRFYERHGFKALAFGDGRDNEERCPDILLELAG